MSTVLKTSRPLYQQIRSTLVDRILSGEFKEGDLLPSARNLAVEMQVNPVTISHAYNGLVAAGILKSEKGVGLRLAIGSITILKKEAREDFVANVFPALREQAERLGFKIALSDVQAGIVDMGWFAESKL